MMAHENVDSVDALYGSPLQYDVATDTYLTTSFAVHQIVVPGKDVREQLDRMMEVLGGRQTLSLEEQGKLEADLVQDVRPWITKIQYHAPGCPGCMGQRPRGGIPLDHPSMMTKDL